MRRQYVIEGNACNDCLASWCCPCCALVQEDQEVKVMEGTVDESGAYVVQPGMNYGPP